MTRWIPLESNPEVSQISTQWAHDAGVVSSEAEFQDIYGLDDDLLGSVPQPVKAVILLFPIRGKLDELRQQEEAKLKEEGQVHIDPTVIWIKQTISNACGTIGLLHSLINARLVYEPESPLTKFIDAYKTPLERAKFLESTDIFTNIHAALAAGGQSAVPDELDTDLHFTCFVQAPDARTREATVLSELPELRLIELDGGRAGPVDRGTSTDLLKDVAKYVKEEIIPKAPSLELSMIALAGGFPDDVVPVGL
ncbi:peptidase C12 ubiquitin carboxyl-terminal hydrolase 1 [Russula dissimulans]|nr:peptidase C12 ubiquitin carboxyl-terminal hydrolase 1 [Russula dissimulans]